MNLQMSIASKQERRQAKDSTDIDDEAKRKLRIEIGKEIQKLIRRKLAARRGKMMAKVMSEFRDHQQLIGTAGTKHIVEVQGEDGRVRREWSEIAQVLASFYESLYESTIVPGVDLRPTAEHRRNGIPPFSLAELKIALKQTRNGKAGDSAGLIAEMLKTSCDRLCSYIYLMTL